MNEKVQIVGYRIRWSDGINEPLMTVAQHERIVAGLEARLREAEGLLLGVYDSATAQWQKLPSKVTDHLPRIDAFLAQTAEGGS